jgi:hypothetical protein
VPGIEDVTISAHAGQELVPLPEGSRYLGFILARAASPEAVEAALRAAHERLDVDIGPAGSAGPAGAGPPADPTEEPCA